MPFCVAKIYLNIFTWQLVKHVKYDCNTFLILCQSIYKAKHFVHAIIVKHQIFLLQRLYNSRSN